MRDIFTFKLGIIVTLLFLMMSPDYPALFHISSNYKTFSINYTDENKDAMELFRDYGYLP